MQEDQLLLALTSRCSPRVVTRELHEELHAGYTGSYTGSYTGVAWEWREGKPDSGSPRSPTGVREGSAAVTGGRRSSADRLLHLGRFHLGRFHLGRFHLGQFHLGRFHLGRFHLGRLHLACFIWGGMSSASGASGVIVPSALACGASSSSSSCTTGVSPGPRSVIETHR